MNGPKTALKASRQISNHEAEHLRLALAQGYGDLHRGILRSHDRRLSRLRHYWNFRVGRRGSKRPGADRRLSTISGSGHTVSLAVERLTYHALLASLQVLLAEDYAGALTIAAAPAFIALLRPDNHAEDPDLQRLRQLAIQFLNQVRRGSRCTSRWSFRHYLSRRPSWLDVLPSLIVGDSHLTEPRALTPDPF